MLLDLISDGQVIVGLTIFQSALLFCTFHSRLIHSLLPLLSYLISILVLFNSSPCSAPPLTTSVHLPAYSVMATFHSFLPNSSPIYHPSRHLRSRNKHHSRSTPSYNYFSKYSTKMRRLRPLPTSPTSFFSEKDNKSALVPLPLLDGQMAGLENFLNFYQAMGRKKSAVEEIPEQTLDSAIQATTTVWQLYNHCSAGFVQTFMGISNANGRVEDVCLINFLVHSLPDGLIMLEQAKLHTFLCFNRRRRLAVRKLKHNEVKCQFREHMTKSGYTLLESARTPGLYLGFNRKGRFQDPSQFNNTKLHRCFYYSKLEVNATILGLQPLNCRTPNKNGNEKISRLHSSHETHSKEQKLMYEVARNTILNRVEV